MLRAGRSSRRRRHRRRRRKRSPSDSDSTDDSSSDGSPASDSSPESSSEESSDEEPRREASTVGYAIRDGEQVIRVTPTIQSFATIRGLKARPELNGQTCQVQYHDPASGRRVVMLQDGTELKLKPANLEPIAGSPHHYTVPIYWPSTDYQEFRRGLICRSCPSHISFVSLSFSTSVAVSTNMSLSLSSHCRAGARAEDAAVWESELEGHRLFGTTLFKDVEISSEQQATLVLESLIKEIHALSAQDSTQASAAYLSLWRIFMPISLDTQQPCVSDIRTLFHTHDSHTLPCFTHEESVMELLKHQQLTSTLKQTLRQAMLKNPSSPVSLQVAQLMCRCQQFGSWTFVEEGWCDAAVAELGYQNWSKAAVANPEMLTTSTEVESLAFSASARIFKLALLCADQRDQQFVTIGALSLACYFLCHRDFVQGSNAEEATELQANNSQASSECNMLLAVWSVLLRVIVSAEQTCEVCFDLAHLEASFLTVLRDAACAPIAIKAFRAACAGNCSKSLRYLHETCRLVSSIRGEYSTDAAVKLMHTVVRVVITNCASICCDPRIDGDFIMDSVASTEHGRTVYLHSSKAASFCGPDCLIWLHHDPAVRRRSRRKKTKAGRTQIPEAGWVISSQLEGPTRQGVFGPTTRPFLDRQGKVETDQGGGTSLLFIAETRLPSCQPWSLDLKWRMVHATSDSSDPLPHHHTVTALSHCAARELGAFPLQAHPLHVRPSTLGESVLEKAAGCYVLPKKCLCGHDLDRNQVSSEDVTVALSRTIKKNKRKLKEIWELENSGKELDGFQIQKVAKANEAREALASARVRLWWPKPEACVACGQTLGVERWSCSICSLYLVCVECIRVPSGVSSGRKSVVGCPGEGTDSSLSVEQQRATAHAKNFCSCELVALDLAFFASDCSVHTNDAFSNDSFSEADKQFRSRNNCLSVKETEEAAKEAEEEAAKKAAEGAAEKAEEEAAKKAEEEAAKKAEEEAAKKAEEEAAKKAANEIAKKAEEEAAKKAEEEAAKKAENEIAKKAEEIAKKAARVAKSKRNAALSKQEAARKAAKQNRSVPGGVASKVPCSPPISICKSEKSMPQVAEEEWVSVSSTKNDRKKQNVTDQDLQQALGQLVTEQLASVEMVGEMATHLQDADPWLAKEIVTDLANKMRSGLAKDQYWTAFVQLLDVAGVSKKTSEPEHASGADGEDRGTVTSPSMEKVLTANKEATTASIGSSLAHARSPDELIHSWAKERLKWQQTQDKLKAECDVLKGALAEQEQCYHQLCRDLQHSKEECNVKEKGWMRANAELAELQAIAQEVEINKVEKPEAVQSACIKMEQLAGLGMRELVELQDTLFERQDELRESQRRVHQQIGSLWMPLCPICEDAPLSIVLVPCGHRLCSDCASGFDVNHNQRNLSICPFCRQGFTQKVVCHDN